MVFMAAAALLTLLALFGPAFAHSYHGRHHGRQSRGALAFVPRGGSTSSSADEADDAELDADEPSLTTLGRCLVGVLDLRPEPTGDEIRTISHGSDEGGGPACDLIVSLPTSSLDGEEADDGGASPSDTGGSIEDALDEQSANSHCIGRACSTVCLLLSYDFEAGKTNLHRTFGGAKLMALVDGARSRWHESQRDGGGGGVTRLVIFLHPANPGDSQGGAGDVVLANNEEWNSSGAVFLVDRLVEAFALGGEAFEIDQPFNVEFVKVSTTDETLRDNVQRHVLTNARRSVGLAKRDRDVLASAIGEAYESAGGDQGSLSFL